MYKPTQDLQGDNVGNLSHFDLRRLISDYGCRHLVETGTGMGVGVGHALGFPFETIYSIEVEWILFLQGQTHFSKHPDDRVRLYHGESLDVLPKILAQIPDNEPIMFWLDAHFPGADFRIRNPGDEWIDTIRLPLETELSVIKAARPLGKDVILCDDARIYIDGPFTSGNIPDEYRSVCPRKRDVSFIHSMFSETHEIEVTFEEEGFITMLPHEQIMHKSVNHAFGNLTH